MLQSALFWGLHFLTFLYNDDESSALLDNDLVNNLWWVYLTFLPQLKLSSIGLKSGEYGGRYSMTHPDAVVLKNVCTCIIHVTNLLTQLILLQPASYGLRNYP